MYTVAMVCQKGGAGKSTLGIHLAVEGERRGLRTLVIDLDPQASAAKILDRRGEERPDVVTEHPARLDAALAAAEKRGYELVVLDTAPQADQAALRAARAAQLVVVPVRPSIMDIDAVQATIEVCELARCRAVFVLNAVPPQGTEADETEQAVQARGGKVAGARIGTRKLYAQAFNSGRAAQELEPASKAAAEVVALYEELHIPTPRRAHKRTRAHVRPQGAEAS